MTNIEIGNRIRIAREKKGLNKKELAQKIQVADSTIKRYEDGDIKKIKMPIIESIANTLHINPMWIIGKEPIMERDPYWEEEKHLEIDFHDFLHSYLGYNSPYTLDGNVDIQLKKNPDCTYRVSAKEYDDFYEFTKERIDREFSYLLNKAEKILRVNENKILHISESDTTYLEPNAAHDRTDIPDTARTEDAVKQESDMMDDPNF